MVPESANTFPHALYCYRNDLQKLPNNQSKKKKNCQFLTATFKSTEPTAETLHTPLSTYNLSRAPLEILQRCKDYIVTLHHYFPAKFSGETPHPTSQCQVMSCDVVQDVCQNDFSEYPDVSEFSLTIPSKFTNQFLRGQDMSEMQ